jgi:NodT family efflux transporter outer membrane factor (OMF) lipoprotein
LRSARVSRAAFGVPPNTLPNLFYKANLVQRPIYHLNFCAHLILLFLATFIAGCTVGPDYQPPKVTPPTQWISPQAAQITNAPPTDDAWWKSFHDDELNSLIARAAQSNLTLQVAVARVREARAAARVVSADLYPTLNADGSYTRVRYSANGFPPFPPGTPLDANVYQAGFDAAWEVDVFGGTRRAIEAATNQVAAAEFGRRDLLVTVSAEVARNYVAARTFQRRLSVADDNIKAQSQVLAVTRDRFERGITSQLDVQEADALLQETQAETPTLENGFRAAVYQLSLLLGQPPGAVLAELTNSAPIPASPPMVPVGLPADLMQRRPDVQQAERQLAAATAQVGVATADLYPKFSLTGLVALQTIDANNWFTAGSRFWSVGPTAQWRIFDAGRIRANINVQNERVAEALATYEQSMLSAFTDVETALTAYAREQTRRESLDRATQANTQAVNISTDLYRNGLADFLRVLESQRSLYQSQDELIQSESAVTSDLIALYKALGGGWEEKNFSAN